jgi:AcrR family transcriptional regulator
LKKQPEITAKTKKAFVDAFCELYCRKPIEKISVQEIANRAGYNRSSFYQHFCDIYELLDCLENDVLESIRQKLSDGQGSIQETMSILDENKSYLKALFGDYGNGHFTERLKANIPYEAHKLNISKDDPITPYLMEFHLSTVFSLYRLWYRRNRDISPEEFLSLVFCLYTGGISAVIKDI